jgi:hypothetical protein
VLREGERLPEDGYYSAFYLIFGKYPMKYELNSAHEK